MLCTIKRLHRIDLRGKVEKNWREEHGPYILTWDMRQQRLCHAPPQIGEMPYDSCILPLVPSGHSKVCRL